MGASRIGRNRPNSGDLQEASRESPGDTKGDHTRPRLANGWGREDPVPKARPKPMSVRGAAAEAKTAKRSRAAKDEATPPKPPPRGEQEFIVSRSSAERFIKDYASRQGRDDARVRVDAIQRFAGYLDQVALTLVAEALRLATQAKRNTIQAEDFDAAYTVVAGGTANPEGLFASIDKLDTEQLASLVNIISAWLKEKQPGRRS